MMLERTAERILLVANIIEDTRMHGRVISNVLTNQTHSRTITHQ